jgi:hypothetical protein
MGGVVPLKAIVQRDIAPTLGLLYYGSEEPDDQSIADELIQDIFLNPQYPFLKGALKDASKFGLLASVEGILARSAFALACVLAIFADSSLSAERENIDPVVYRRLVRYELELEVSVALVVIMPENIGSSEGFGATVARGIRNITEH